jgi:hypothetical protein
MRVRCPDSPIPSRHHSCARIDRPWFYTGNGRAGESQFWGNSARWRCGIRPAADARSNRAARDIVVGRRVPAGPPADPEPAAEDPHAPGPATGHAGLGRPVTTPAGVVIRPMGPGDAGQVLAVYQAGLDTGLASFETTAPGWEAFDAAKLPGHRFIAADGDGEVLGWVAVSPCSARRVYGGVVEHSVYVRRGYHRRGIGGARSAPSRPAAPATPGPATSTGREPLASRARRQQAGAAASRSRRPSTAIPAATTPAAILRERQSGRSASSPQAEDHPISCSSLPAAGHGMKPTGAPQGICPGGIGFRHPQVPGRFARYRADRRGAWSSSGSGCRQRDAGRRLRPAAG